MTTESRDAIDDEPSMARCLKRLLVNHGLETETFASAEEFLAREPKKHRADVMARMQAGSFTELARMAERLGEGSSDS